MKLSEERILTIGGTSGIGLATAEAALAEGAEINHEFTTGSVLHVDGGPPLV